MQMQFYQITNWCQKLLQLQVTPGGFYIDATVGNGHDTLFLCELAQETGQVLGFDIQPQALHHTTALLKQKGLSHRAKLILESHIKMEEYAQPHSVDAICFNFGYLPGGDHRLSTKPDTSLIAVQKGLELLKNGGVMSLCIYSGQDTGYEEKDALLEFVKGLNPKHYLVIVNHFYNRKNDPPIPVFIVKK